MPVTHTKYLAFMEGYEEVVAPFEQEFIRLRETEDNPDMDFMQFIERMAMVERHRDIAIAEYAGIPSTRRALDELHAATCGSRRSAYAYIVLDELPDDYCAD
jgi:hypothetical protein